MDLDPDDDRDGAARDGDRDEHPLPGQRDQAEDTGGEEGGPGGNPISKSAASQATTAGTTSSTEWPCQTLAGGATGSSSEPGRLGRYRSSAAACDLSARRPVRALRLAIGNPLPARHGGPSRKRRIATPELGRTGKARNSFFYVRSHNSPQHLRGCRQPHGTSACAPSTPHGPPIAPTDLDFRRTPWRQAGAGRLAGTHLRFRAPRKPQGPPVAASTSASTRQPSRGCHSGPDVHFRAAKNLKDCL